MIHLFNRFELKYILDINLAYEIMAELAKFTDYDAFSGPQGYRISSLYYDSPDLDFFWDKVEGIKYRRKVRLRIYPGEDPTRVNTGMVEIKQRINRTVQKRRIKLPLDQAYQLCENQLDISEFEGIDRLVASEVSYLASAKHLQPTCIIDYHRVAFVGRKYNPDLRITFDTQLRCRTQNLRVEQRFENHHFLPANACIMEIKVDETVPNWVSALMSHFNCELNRVSKYCVGVARDKHISVFPMIISPVSLVTKYMTQELKYHESPV